jgi:hypothetical protein
MSPKLSVNVNKIATIRNARGGNNPNVLQVALDCERFGAQGITVHPRPDERHIRFTDVHDLSTNIATEFNIEGYPSEDFLQLIEKVKPHQVTLVPDPPACAHLQCRLGHNHPSRIPHPNHRAHQTNRRPRFYLPRPQPSPHCLRQCHRHRSHRTLHRSLRLTIPPKSGHSHRTLCSHRKCGPGSRAWNQCRTRPRPTQLALPGAKLARTSGSFYRTCTGL